MIRIWGRERGGEARKILQCWQNLPGGRREGVFKPSPKTEKLKCAAGRGGRRGLKPPGFRAPAWESGCTLGWALPVRPPLELASPRPGHRASLGLRLSAGRCPGCQLPLLRLVMGEKGGNVCAQPGASEPLGGHVGNGLVVTTRKVRRSWRLVSRDQGCCQTSYSAQDHPHGELSPSKCP